MSTDSVIMLRRNFKHTLRNPTAVFNAVIFPVVLLRLRTLLRHLGEPCLAEVTPRVPLDPGRIRVGAIRQSAYADAGREQPCRLLVLVVAER